MSNWPLMLQPLAKYAEFNGRSRRSEFWLWVLFRILVGMALSTILSTVMMNVMLPIMSNPQPDMHAFFSQYMRTVMTIMPIYSLLHIGLLLPTIAVGVRRLHDIGRTGWWYILPHAVAIVGLIVFFIIFGAQIYGLVQAGEDKMTDEQTFKFVFTLFGSMFLCVFLPVIAAWIVMLVFYVTEGKRGPNRFGNDPKGPALNDTP